MKLIRNMKIRAKLLLIILPLGFSLVASLLCTYQTVNKIEDQLTMVYHDSLYTVNNYLLAADRDYYQALVGATGYYDIMMGFNQLPQSLVDEISPGYYSDYETNREQVYDKVEKAIAIVKNIDSLYTGTTVDGATFKQMYDNLMTELAAWDASFTVKTLQGDWSNFNTTFNTARNSIDVMQEITDAWAEKEQASVKNQVRGILTSLMAVFIFIILVLLALTVLVVEQIIRPIRRVSATLGEIAEGNLLVELQDDSKMGRDELGVMERSTKNLALKLGDVIGKTKSAAKEVDDQSRELADSANQATSTSGQVTDAIGEISKGAISQAESIEKAATDTSDIDVNISDITNSVEAMDRCADDMKTSCDKAMSALNTLIKQSESVTASVKEIGDTINSTNNSSKEISQFTQAITDIASQTNLLSLNASIEAARAGEAGRGFAVVADEIRQLADQSADSADKIKAVVERLLSDSESSLSVLDKLNTSFGEQATQLDITRSDMESMSESVENVKATSDDINNRIKALDEAKNGLTEIIADLSAISEENAASTQETNASMEELNATFTIISDSADKLQSLSNDLAQTIAYFKN